MPLGTKQWNRKSVHLDPARAQRTGKGFRVFVQDARDAQVVRGLGIGLCVVHKDRLVIRKVAGLHQRGEDLRLGLEQMDITGGNAAVKQ